MTTKPAFGKLQGYGQVAPSRTYARDKIASTPQAYAPPQPSNYAEIVGNAFQGNYHPDSYDGFPSFAKPVKGLRFLSATIDFTILIVVSLLFAAIVAVFDKTPTGSGMPDALFLGLIVLWFGYGIVLEASRFQGTFGKVVTGTVVVNEDGSRPSLGKVIWRNVAKFISACVPFYLSYTMVFFTKNNQSLHDYMSKSYVYKRSDLSKIGESVFD